MNQEQIKQLQDQLERQMQSYNRSHQATLDNLSPLDIHNILYGLFEENSLIDFILKSKRKN